MSTLTASTLAAQHILTEFYRTPRSKPLFVGIQGPQGSGKTHLSRTLVSLLSSPPYSLYLAVFSVDDLYLTHDGLVDLAARNSENRLWKGRGQPGTHDIELGADILKRLRDLTDIPVTLPIFDKSKFNGEGDRLSEGVYIERPVDIVILEGWCMGFHPLDNEALNKRWDDIISRFDSSNDLDIVQRCMDGISKRDIEQVNGSLHGYVQQWYPYFEAFIQIRSPNNSPFAYIYKWRLQQEHDMKARNGGFGMTDDQVVRFIDRYIPGYVFFGAGIEHGGPTPPPWNGRGLCITIDENRKCSRHLSVTSVHKQVGARNFVRSTPTIRYPPLSTYSLPSTSTMAKLTMGTEAAFALQAKIQAELAARGYSSETDTVMAEYITIMVINDKTAEQINAELADLIGADYDPSFTEWLFAETAKVIEPAAQIGSTTALKENASVTEEPQPINPSRRGSGGGGVGLLQSALSGINPPTAPSALRQSTSPSAQKRTASARSPSPSTNGPNKTRRTDTPTGPRAMMERSDRSSSSTNNNQGGRSLIDRVGGHARRGNINTGPGGLSQAQVSQIQAKIDGITGSQPNLMLGHPQVPMPMNAPPMNFSMQEMMMMNFDMMRQMANTLGMMAPNGMGGAPSMGGFGLPQQLPGFVPQMGMPPQQQQQQGHGGMSRGGHHRGDSHGRGRGRGHSNQFTIPIQDVSASSSATLSATPAAVPVAQSASQQPAQPPVQETGIPTVTDLSAPARPGTPSLCKFGLKCTNPQCRFSHPSPVATAESGVVLSTEFCPRGRECRDKHCTLGHVSPSVLNGPTPMKPVTHAPVIPAPSAVPTPCKFGVLCTRPGCIFTHPPNFRPSHHSLSHQSTSTVPCRFGTSCTRSDCPFQHPKGHVPANMFYKGLGPDAPLVEAYVSPHRSVRFGDSKSTTTTKENATKNDDNKVKDADGLSNDKATEKTVDVGA